MFRKTEISILFQRLGEFFRILKRETATNLAPISQKNVDDDYIVVKIRIYNTN